MAVPQVTGPYQIPPYVYDQNVNGNNYGSFTTTGVCSPDNQIATIEREEPSDVLLIIGPKNKCNHKVEIFPGIKLFLPHPPPNRFRRLIFYLFFGWKWKSTLTDRFLDAL